MGISAVYFMLFVSFIVNFFLSVCSYCFSFSFFIYYVCWQQFISHVKLLHITFCADGEKNRIRKLKIVVIKMDTAAGVVPCGGPKKSPRTSSIVQVIFSF